MFRDLDVEFPALESPVGMPETRKQRRLRKKTCGNRSERFGGGSIATSWPAALHFERQVQGFCALHALNHAVGSAAFVVQDMELAVQDIVDEAAACAAAQGVDCEECASNHKGTGGGYYSEQVMARVLENSGDLRFDQTPLRLQAGFEQNLWDTAVCGAVIHIPGHWMALRCAEEELWLIDSRGLGPRSLGRRGDPEVGEVLSKYANIFLLRVAEHSTREDPGDTAQHGVPEVKKPEGEAAGNAEGRTQAVLEGDGVEEFLSVSDDGQLGVCRSKSVSEVNARRQALQEVENSDNSSQKLASAPLPSALRAPSTEETVAEEFDSPSTREAPCRGGAQSEHDACPAGSRVGAAEQRQFMREDFGQDRLDADVSTLVGLYVKKGDWKSFLRSLPLFDPVDTLEGLTSEFDYAVQMLCRDQVNSTAALQVRPCLVGTMTYPLLVLLHATALSQGIPTVFFVDVFHAVVNSVLHKEYAVEMGRWKSKSRHWWVGTANVGEGKSPGMKHFVNAMIEVLEELQPQAVGEAADRFHFQQSGTTASAIDKLRSCDAYLAVYCPDAVRCLCPAAAVGGKTDPYQFIDLEMFLDAAHGDEFSHSTCRLREKTAKAPLVNPQAPAKKKPPTHLDPTNVHFIFLQQEVVFATWWAQMTPKKPVGIAQRFLMSFGGDADPAPMQFASFMEDVATPPRLKDLLRLIVSRIRPVVPGAEVARVVCTKK